MKILQKSTDGEKFHFIFKPYIAILYPFINSYKISTKAI